MDTPDFWTGLGNKALSLSFWQLITLIITIGSLIDGWIKSLTKQDSLVEKSLHCLTDMGKYFIAEHSGYPPQKMNAALGYVIALFGLGCGIVFLTKYVKNSEFEIELLGCFVGSVFFLLIAIYFCMKFTRPRYP